MRPLVDIRIYRAALMPVLLAIVVVMFSLQERPPPLSSSLAPDAFDAKGAHATLLELVDRHPDRRPGSADNAQVAGLVEGRLRSLAGFETRRDRFTAEVDGDETPMSNVVGVLSGPSPRQIVVMAHRDARHRPGASSAADTAVLLELAKALAGVRHEKTIVFVSTDGGGADNAGARRFASEYADRDEVDAVLVLADVGAADARRPFVLPWSTDDHRAGFQVVRSTETALERELDADAGSESIGSQFIRQAWPLTLREQGPLNEQELDAVTLTAAGELPPRPANDTVERISRVRILDFGKAALAGVLALDSSGIESSPGSYLDWGRNLMPGWAVSLLAFALLAPALALALDGLARARRRDEQIGGWIRWTLASGLPFAVTLLAAYAFELFGWLPSTAAEAIAPASRPTFAEVAPALAGLVLVFALSWMLVRPLAAGAPRERSGPEAAVAAGLVLAVALVVLWAGNPFAALLMVPAAHLALLFALPERPSRAPLAGMAMAFVALLFPALALLHYGGALDLGLDPTRYALLLVAGGGSLFDVLLVSVIAGALSASLLVALTRRDADPAPEITVRGPHSYAGPGSLGGTESALRR